MARRQSRADQWGGATDRRGAASNRRDEICRCRRLRGRPAAGVRRRLRVSLPTAAQQQGVVVQPLVVAGAGVFAEENAVYGIRLDDGRELWRHAFSTGVGSLAGAVYGMWPGAPGAVVVLTGQVTQDARLTELYPATGAVGWTLRLPPGLYGSQALARPPAGWSGRRRSASAGGTK